MNNVDNPHFKVLSYVSEMCERDKKLLKSIFPSGYEDVQMPVFTIHQKCSKCNARTLHIYRGCKENGGERIALFCNCFTCSSDYLIFRNKNQINICQLETKD